MQPLFTDRPITVERAYYPLGPTGRKSVPRNSAFTLVELLVVIAVIGLLVALLLPAVQAARNRRGWLTARTT